VWLKVTHTLVNIYKWDILQKPWSFELF
jgi:hypothetical protein